MKFSIAIDGPAASGKSSAAGIIAKALGLERIDSGLLYRALTYLIYEKFEPEDTLDLTSQDVKTFVESLEIKQKNAKIYYNGKDITANLRTPRVDLLVVNVAKQSYIREKTQKIQRSMLLGDIMGVVIDGRDIGTVVLPEAFLKVFITAKDTVRARRRSLETGEVYEDVLNKLQKRDYEDIHRIHGPLKIASDAILIENDNVDLYETVKIVVRKLRDKLAEDEEKEMADDSRELMIERVDDYLRDN